MRRKILMDCDPGVDDMAAISLAAANRDSLDILAITTVAGNKGIDIVTRNALALLKLLGAEDIPVARGCKLPLVGSPYDAEFVHGAQGRGNAELPLAERAPNSENAVTFMRDVIMAQSCKVTLVPTAPLTNVALLLRAFPEVTEKIELICLMGGSAGKGNITEFAEFNIWFDPEAAHIVFESGLPIVMCGLDVTHACGMTINQAHEMSVSGKPITTQLGKMLEFCLEKENVRKGRDEMNPVHDTVPITYLLHPELFGTEDAHVETSCGSAERGRTVCRFDAPVEKRNAKVVMSVDAAAFNRTLLRDLYSLDK